MKNKPALTMLVFFLILCFVFASCDNTVINDTENNNGDEETNQPENILLWGFVEDAGEDENESYIFPDKDTIDYSLFTRIENFNGDGTFAMIGSGFRCIVTPIQIIGVYEPNSPYSTTNVIESWTQEGTIIISGSVYYLLRSGPGNNTGNGGLTIKVITQTE